MKFNLKYGRDTYRDSYETEIESYNWIQAKKQAVDICIDAIEKTNYEAKSKSIVITFKWCLTNEKGVKTTDIVNYTIDPKPPKCIVDEHRFSLDYEVVGGNIHDPGIWKYR